MDSTTLGFLIFGAAFAALQVFAFFVEHGEAALWHRPANVPILPGVVAAICFIFALTSAALGAAA